MQTITQTSAQSSFDASRSRITGLGGNKVALLRLLRSTDTVGHKTHQESGRLDKRAFSRVGAGRADVFKVKGYAPAVKSAVSILIDLSASMTDGNSVKLDMAQDVAITLADILDRAKVSFAVTGFTDGRDSKVNINGNSYKMDNPMFVPFKKWGEPLRRSQAKLGCITLVNNSGTPDYASFINALDQLDQQKEKRKVLFVITDTEGFITPHVKHVQSVADRLGIVLVVIGLHAGSSLQYFTNSVNVKKISDLADVAFKQVIKSL